MNKNSTISNDYFDINLFVDDESTDMTMDLKTPYQTTKSLPHTHETLTSYFPAVLQTKCFNSDNLPFNEKVKDTNLAHLFEHILLQYMIEEGDALGYKSTSYKGVTSWDWRKGKDSIGTYKIKISVKKDEEVVLKNALKKSVELVEKLLKTANNESPVISKTELS